MNSMSEDIVHKECGKNPATDPNVNALLLYWYIYMSENTKNQILNIQSITFHHDSCMPEKKFMS